MRFMTLLAAMAASASIGAAAVAGGPDGDGRHVVLVSIDGLAASYLTDPRAHLPTLRRLAREGAVADGMITSFPSITWPSHVSLITGVAPGKHGVIANSFIDRKTRQKISYIGDATFTKQQAVRVPTIYDAAFGAGLKTASIIWPATPGAETLHWMIPDSDKESLHRTYTTPGLAEELDAAGISIAKLGQWGWQKEYSAIRDATYTRVTTHLLEKHQPHLLLLHLISPDGIEHAYGPQTEEAYWAVNDSDNRIREIWETLQRPPLAGRSTLIVVSDHGFAPYERIVNTNVLLKQAGLVTVDEKNVVTSATVWSLSAGGADLVYILDDENREAIRRQIKPMLAALEGVERVLDVADFMRYGLPDPGDNPQQADLMLAAKPGYSFGNEHAGDNPVQGTPGLLGTHGHLPEPAYMHATFIAVGSGIKPGTHLERVSNLDVAPTIAGLLGVDFPTADGRVLTEILDESVSAPRKSPAP